MGFTSIPPENVSSKKEREKKRTLTALRSLNLACGRLRAAPLRRFALGTRTPSVSTTIVVCSLNHGKASSASHWARGENQAEGHYAQHDPEGTPHGCGSKPMGSHFGVGAPPILEPILVGIGLRAFDLWPHKCHVTHSEG